jgi:hypothetical protein
MTRPQLVKEPEPQEIPELSLGKPKEDTLKERIDSLRKFLETYPGPAIITCRLDDYDKKYTLGLPEVKVLKLSLAGC